MLDSQAVYGPHDQALVRSGDVAFGRALYRLLPEDRYDTGPLIGPSGHFLVADARLDNRAELIAALGGNGSDHIRLSDAGLLLACFERWGENLLDRISGDFAFAVWMARERRLLLVRDPLGQRPLCYFRSPGLLAFGSMPNAIHALGVARAANERRIAEYMADLVFPNGRSFYDGISVVRPGEIVTLTVSNEHARRYWNPLPQTLRLNSFPEYVEAFREKLDQAVASRLRGADQAVGCHLSSGYDSSAVAATAARLLRPSGGRVVAFTSAPRIGFAGPELRGRIADESGVAAITAALHSNMDHVVLRPNGANAFKLLNEIIGFAQQPVGHVCNAVWWMAIGQAAKERGLKVMLTGEVGNLTISAGNLFQLADMIRTGEWSRWWREARAVIKHEGVNWRGVLANSFGPWVPRPLWFLVSHIFQGTSLTPHDNMLLSRSWDGEMRSQLIRLGRERRPPKDSRALRIRLLQWTDHGNARKMMLARWGIDERDPTNDRKLIEFCLSLPPEMLLEAGYRRPLARAALSDRLPPEVLDNRMRGAQMVDWYEQITQSAALDCFAEISHNAAARRVIDLNKVGAMIRAWPKSGWESMALENAYRAQVLHALSAASFISHASS